MSVVGTSATTRRMTLRSATRSGEPKRAHEKFFHGNRAPNTTDSGTRQVHLEEVNRALAHEETGGLDNIYEMPEPRSTTSRSAMRTGSPLTSLPASTPMMGISLPASTPVMGEWETRLHELCHAFYFTTPFSQGPYPPCYSEVQESMQELMGMFAKDWQNTPHEERDYNHGLVPGGDQVAMFDSLWVALLTDPQNENTSHRDVFSKSLTPRFTVKSKIDDNEEQDCFSIFNTPTRRTGGRRVTLSTQQPENDGASRDACPQDIPPHLTWCEGHEEAREVPQYEQGLFGQRYQNLLPLPPPGREGGGPGGEGPGGGGTDSSDNDNDDDRRHCRERREVCLV